MIEFAVLVADPGLPAWTNVASGSLLGLMLVTVVVLSIRGTITWPPEKKRMETTISDLTLALRDSIKANERTAPTVGRVAELVQQRVLVPATEVKPASEPSTADLMKALTRLQSDLEKVTGNDFE